MKKIGKYEIIEELGKGGMGVVYKAWDPNISRTVAIKVILEKALEITEVKERFLREAQTAGNLHHENITVVYDMGEEDGQPYIVMEYLEGVELREIIREKKEIKLEQKIEYAIQMCKGLQKAHDHDIIHRDIKPENIHVQKDGKLKIMDFGIARPVSSTLTVTGVTIGTPYYMSPEQLKGFKVGKVADIFSFGAVFYELLTYKRPFEGETIESVMYKILQEEPEELKLEDVCCKDLQVILSKCLAKQSEDRYADFKKIIVDLNKLLGKIQTAGMSVTDRDLLATIPIQAQEKGTVKPKSPAKKSSRMPLMFAGLVVILGATGFWFWRSSSSGVSETTVSSEIAAPPVSLQNLKADMTNLEGQVEDMNVASYAQASLDLARTLKSEAAEAEAAGDFTVAENLLTSAINKFKESIETASGEIEKKQAEEAETDLASKEIASKSPGIVEKRPQPDKPKVDPIQRAEAFNLQQTVQSKRTETDATGANVTSIEAYKYAFDLEKQGINFLKKSGFKRANTVFESAISGYDRAQQEKETLDKARLQFEMGSYNKGLAVLEDVFKDTPYNGSNKKALKLQSDITAASSLKENRIEDSNNAMKAGELRVAMFSLNTLPERDRKSSEVQNLIKKIVSGDKTPPVVAHTPEDKYKPNEPIAIQSRVQDNLSVKTVTLHYQKKGTKTFSEVGMKFTQNDKSFFTGYVPLDYHKGKEVRYYFTAKDSNGNEKVLGSRKKPFKIKSKQKDFVAPAIP